jgi:hypothetical protein
MPHHQPPSVDEKINLRAELVKDINTIVHKALASLAI